MKSQSQAFAYSGKDETITKDEADDEWEVEVKKRHFNPQVFLYFLIALAFVLAIYQAVVIKGSLGWLFMLKPLLSPPAAGDVGVALGPILALSLMIERVLETIFELFERNWTQVARFGTAASDGGKHLNQMLNLYNGQLTVATDELEAALGSREPRPEAETNALMQKVSDAEKLVRDASERMALMIKDPKYLAWKRAITIWLGLTLGLIVAIISDVGVFEHLNITVPRLVDMLITGFVIGAGSGPLHSLIGILQSAKSTLDSVGSFANTAGLRKEVEDLKEAASRNNNLPPNQTNIIQGN